MGYLWHELTGALPLIFHGNSYIVQVTEVTIEVALVATALALVIGLPIGTALGLGRFRGRRVLLVLANTTLALPPVLVGVFGLLLLLPQGPFGGLRIEFTLNAVFLAQAILALPYIIALLVLVIVGRGAVAPGALGQPYRKEK